MPPVIKAATKLSADHKGKSPPSRANIKPLVTRQAEEYTAVAASELLLTKRVGQLPHIKVAGEGFEEAHLMSATSGLDFTSGVVRVTRHLSGGRARALDDICLAEQALSVENVWFKAAGYFRDAILADPTYAPAYEGLARSVFVEGEWTVAEAALRTAISLDPNLGKARFQLGAVAERRGEYATAIAVWQDLVAREPDYPDVYSRMAIASYFGHDFSSAWSYLVEADKRGENVPSQFRDLLQQVAPR